MASVGCRTSRATSRPRRSSKPIRSASSTSTSPRCRPLKASSTSSSPSTGPASLPSSSWSKSQPRHRLGLPRRPHRSRALQDPHRPDRQRHPVPSAAALRRRPDRSVHRRHMFAMRCRENGIEHRCTKINHPWTNGQVERMNRTIKEATVQRYHYDTHDAARAPPHRLRQCLQLRPPAEDPQGSHTIRIHLQSLDNTSQNDSPSIRSTKCRD